MTMVLNRFFAMFLVVGSVLALMAVSFEAEARRFGGGFSSGRQSMNVMQQKQAVTPAAASTTAGAGAAGARSAGSRWLGPLAGIAAGLGLAALLSHFGLGGALADLLVIALIAGIAIFGLGFLMRALRGGLNPSTASAGTQTMQRRQFEADRPESAPMGGLLGPGPLHVSAQQPSIGDWFIPADFDQQIFLQEAKKQFIAVQKAWDDADYDQLRDRLTDELYAEYAPKLTENGANHTEVVILNANLLGIEKLADGYLASVRFSGMIREDHGAQASAFEEVWNLYKPDGKRWLLAGIQQV